MNAMKSLVVLAVFGLSLSAVAVAEAQTETKPAGDAKAATPAQAATDAKPAATDTVKGNIVKSDDKGGEKKFTKSQIEAFLSKCSDEAEAKGLTVKSGKSAARKEFRRECMRKFGVSPKKD